jgi:flagellar transcriptional activator FlhC
MANKSLVSEAKEIRLAIELIHLGARLQLLELETSLSRERLLKLYKELKGVSPPKGMLPFSTDWFVTWQPNIHSSLFINIHRFLVANAGIAGIEAIMKAYQLYLEQMPPDAGEEPVLSLTRAWTLIRFFENKMLTTAECHECRGHFVAHRFDLHDHYSCGLCHMPSRAGKTRKLRDEGLAREVSVAA